MGKRGSRAELQLVAVRGHRVPADVLAVCRFTRLQPCDAQAAVRCALPGPTTMGLRRTTKHASLRPAANWQWPTRVTSHDSCLSHLALLAPPPPVQRQASALASHPAVALSLAALQQPPNLFDTCTPQPLWASAFLLAPPS